MEILKKLEDIVSYLEKNPSLNTSENLFAINILLQQVGNEVQMNSLRLREDGATSVEARLFNLRARTSRLGVTAGRGGHFNAQVQDD
jgi:hypothetical protein